MEVFGSSGTRGVVNETLTPTFVVQVAQAAGTVFEADRVALARDTRTTGEMLANAAASGLASVGCDVDRLGVVPTPGAQRYAGREGVPLIIITASHNPPEFNGIKLVGDDGVELAIETLERIEDVLISETFETVPWDETGDARHVDGVREAYREDLLASVDRETIADADLRVALDPGHGAGSLVTPAFLRDLGCSVVTVNAQPDGHFPGRNPEPVPDELDDLQRLVRAADADLGIAHDGDADRATFVDETGAPINGSSSFAALAAAHCSPGDTLVSAVSVSQRVVDVVEDCGADIELTSIGSTNIVARIRDLQADGRSVPIAGEDNGGVFFPEQFLARDGALIAAHFLELVAETPASDLVAPYDDYHRVRENVEYESDAERERMVSRLEVTAMQEADEGDDDVYITTTDGFRLDYGDAWVLSRPSGTEPLLRVYAEARDKERAENLARWFKDVLEEAREEV